MATIVLEKIQLRRGLAADLPGAPITTSPPTFAPGLDEGELGYATDVGRLFIGLGTDVPVSGMPNFSRVGFPDQNIEVLTENSPLGMIFGNAVQDNQFGFQTSVPLGQLASFTNLQTLNQAGVASDFYLDLPGSGANAYVQYFVFDSSNNAIRQGRLSILWNPTFVTAPLCTDEADVLVGAVAALQFQAVMVNAGFAQHVVIRYINCTGGAPTIYFRLDRPVG